MENTTKFDVIVVGGGIAGLTGAAYLANNGFTTLLCERSDRLGGLVGSFKAEGFTFDSGLRAFENSGIIQPMLKELGISLNWITNPVTVGIKDDLILLRNRGNLYDYQQLLNAQFPDNTADIAAIVAEIERVMGYMDILYAIDNPYFMDMTKDQKFLVKTLLPWLVKYQLSMRKIKKLTMPINTYLKQFTTNQSLIDMVTQHFFKNTPSFFALSYFALYLDYSYPLGGTGVLAETMADFIQEKGGTIRLNAEVNQIDLITKVLTTADGSRFAYDKLVWAADMKGLYQAIGSPRLTNAKQQKSMESQQKLVQQSHGSDSILTIFLGVDQDKQTFEKQCSAHTFYTPATIGVSSLGLDSWRDILNTELPDDTKKSRILDWISRYFELTTYEISFPVMRDPSLAPEGKTGIIVSTLFDYDLAKWIIDAGWYDEYKTHCQNEIVRILEESLFPKLSDNIILSMVSTPITLERMNRCSEGAISGWAFTDTAMPSESRFHKMNKSIYTPLPDVYQAGQWTFSPAGAPVAVLTGKLAADAVLKDRKKQH